MIVILSFSRLFPLALQLFMGTKALVGMTAFQEFLGGLAMIARMGGLEIRAFIPGYSQPAHPIQDSPYGLFC